MYNTCNCVRGRQEEAKGHKAIYEEFNFIITPAENHKYQPAGSYLFRHLLLGTY